MDAGEAKTVGALLRKIRFKRDMTLEQVAGLAGISAGFLSRVERGLAPLERLSHWRGVADALPYPALGSAAAGGARSGQRSHRQRH